MNIILLIVAMLALPRLGITASFDCAKAALPVEKRICANSELSELDEQLSKIYEDAGEEVVLPEHLAQQQYQWILLRNVCQDDVCIAQQYHERMTALQTMLSQKIPDEIANVLKTQIQKDAFYSGVTIDKFFTESVDLNQDGVQEIFVRAPQKAPNYELWIYTRKGNAYVLLLDASTGIAGVRLLKTITNRYPDLRTYEHASAAEHEITIYQFDGKRYRPHSCLTEKYIGTGGDVGTPARPDHFTTRQHKCSDLTTR